MVITLSIPETGHCLLKENQKVEFGVPYLEKKSESKVEVEVAKKLDIDPSKIFHHLKKLVGEKIKKGETLALKKGMFTTSRVKSDFDGTIQEINHNTGVVMITTEVGDNKTFNSYFKGKVKKIEDNELKLEVEKADEFKLANATGDFGGEVFYYTDKVRDILSSDVTDKVVVAETVNAFTQIKAEALGCKGFATMEKIEEKSDETSYAQLKGVGDLDKIIKHDYPYCLVDKKNSRIVFYK